MNKFLSRGILALGALLTLAVAATSAQAGSFSFAGININGLVNISQIPEPATMILLGSSLIGMAGAIRKRRNVPKS